MKIKTALFFSLFALSGMLQAAEPIKALLVTGGCCHDYDRQRLIIPQGVSARADVRWTVVRQGGKTTNTRIPLYDDPNWADGFDIVVHNECFAAVKDPDWVDRVLKPHREGLPGVLIHCAMHSYRTGDDRWFEFCGVQSPGHGAHYAFTLKNVWKDHFVMQDFGDEWQVPKGELYHTVKTFPGVSVLAEGIAQPKGDKQTSIWAHEYGENKARVFGTTVGHYNETMAEPTYLDVLARGMLWAVGREGTELKPVSDETDAEIKALVNIPLGEGQILSDVKVKPIEGNLAHGKPATAKSEQTGNKNFIANGNDGKSNTRWCASGSQGDEWWQVDLEKPAHIRGVRIFWEKANHQYKYTLSGSSDGEKWTLLADESKNDKVNGIATHDLDAPNTRYLRVHFINAGGLWGSFYEFEAFDKKMPEPSKQDQAAVLSSASVSDVKAPPGFEVTLFGKPPTVNYPECLTAAISGEVFVGVDEQGSLGKKPGGGKGAALHRCGWRWRSR